MPDSSGCSATYRATHAALYLVSIDLEHVEVQVLSVESGDGDLRGVEPQDTDDVAADALGGGGGERGYGRPGRQAGDELADAEI